MSAFLNHNIDKVGFVAFQNHSKQQQTGRLLAFNDHVGLQNGQLLSNHEVSARVHEHLGVDLWCIVFQHQGRVDQTDCFETKWEWTSEGEELKVNLAELYVKLSEVSDVIKEDSLAEVALQKLVLQRRLRATEDELESVKSDLVFLDIWVHENQTFNSVVDAVSDKIVLQEQLFTKYKTKISLGQQSV